MVSWGEGDCMNGTKNKIGLWFSEFILMKDHQMEFSESVLLLSMICHLLYVLWISFIAHGFSLFLSTQCWYIIIGSRLNS